MHLRKNIKIHDFLEAIKTCDGDVFFKTPEGDCLNLKSTLCQYIFTSISDLDTLVCTGSIVCDLQDDYIKLKDFLVAS
jgi:hypothetical protein